MKPSAKFHWLLCLLVFPSMCNKMQPPQTSPMTCSEIQVAIQEGDYQDWMGVNGDCDWGSWTGTLPSDWREVPFRSLGTEFVHGHRIILDLEGYNRPSLYFAKGQMVMFEARSPELAGELKDLIAHLGEPAAKLDWDFGTLPMPKGEWIYPDRGITLFLNGEQETLFHIAVYASTNLETYLARLRPSFLKKRLPYNK